jgi:hypothetical protein
MAMLLEAHLKRDLGYIVKTKQVNLSLVNSIKRVIEDKVKRKTPVLPGVLFSL